MGNKLLFKSLLTGLALNFLALSSFAQEGRLPTKEELRIKEEKLALYKHNPNAAKTHPNHHLMVTGPEQDCDNATAVCQQSYTQNNSYTGFGSVQEVFGTCLSGGENSSSWYVFTVQNTGTFTFLLQTANDYDFALYDITSIGCAGVPSATPVRCNYSGTYGNTGLVTPVSATIPLSNGAGSSPTMPGLNVTAGQTYALIIDNFTQDNNGYTLSFGGSASIFDQSPPTATSLTSSCTTNILNVVFSEPIQCSSITTGNFTITGPSGNVPVTAAAGTLCSTGASFTSSVDLAYNGAGLPSGTYTVTIGGNISDKCGNVMTPTNLTFQHLGTISIATSTPSVCSGNPVTINVSGGTNAATYNWTPSPDSDSSLTVTPAVSTTYNCQVTLGGCSQTVSQSITISPTPVVTVNPSNVSLCSGTTTLIASATVGGVATACNFTWSGASSQVDNSVLNSTINNAGAGTYTVTVASTAGCPGNSATSTVSIGTPAAVPSCAVVFVSPAGGGTGLTPGSPTDISTALGMAQCNNLVIKMQIGDYTISNPLSVTSFLTIEGGYNTTFTQKTSAKATAGGFPAQGTRIIRNTSNPEGVAGSQRLTVFNVTAGSSFIRFQDLILQVQNSAAGAKISNYAIYLGSGCHDYDVVRCLIDAGKGSDGNPGTGGSPGVGGGNAIAGSLSTASYALPLPGTSPVAGQTGGWGGFGGGIADDFGIGYDDVNNNGVYNAGIDITYAGGNWFVDINGNGVYNAGIDVANSGGMATTYGGENGFGPGGTYSATAITSWGVINGGGAGGTQVSVACGTASVANGANGAAGTPGSTGAAGVNGTATFAGGYFAPGDGTNGTSGTNGTAGTGGGAGAWNNNGFGSYGGLGGAGGGAGSAGTFGTFGTGAGGAFGIFSVNKGVNANVTDCSVAATLASTGTGGNGGLASSGGTGCAGTPGVNTFTGANCNTNRGGAGGAGGGGGAGGAGGSGSASQTCLVCDLNGVTLTSDPSFVNFAVLTTQPVIQVDNIACTNINMNHTTAAGAPTWSSFGSGSSPSSGAGSPATTLYTTTGRKDIVMNANTYTGFNNIIITLPSTGTVLASATSICPGNATFNSSVAGTPGFTYSWSVSPSAGVTIGTGTASSTSMTFPNAGSTTITYTVTLTITSACCGTLTPVTTTIDVNPYPAAPAVNDTALCTGGSVTLTANTPAGSSFAWYDASSGGTLLGNGPTLTLNPVNTSTTVYVEATNASGCTSLTRDQVNVTVNQVPAPTAVNTTTCDTGYVSVSVSPVSGATTYNWYAGPVGGSPVQSGPGLSSSIYVPSFNSSGNIYASVIVPGCTESPRVLVTATVASEITASFTYNPNDSICAGTPTTITVVPQGGNGSFTYSWSPVVSAVDNITVSPAASIGYNVDVTSNGCTKTFNAPLIVNTPPNMATPTANGPVCAGDSIKIFSTVTGVTYGWTGPNGFTDNVQNPVILNASAAASGYYVLTATSLTGGCNAKDSVLVTIGNSPTADAGSAQSLACTVVPVTLDGSASTAAMNYAWTGPTAGTPAGTTPSAVTTDVTTAGTYTLTVSDPVSGCSSTSTVMVNPSPGSPTADAGTPQSITCSALVATLNGNLSTAGMTYAWTGPTAGTPAGTTPAAITTDVNAAGTYTLTVTDSGSGCSSTSTVAVTVNNTVPTADAGSPQSLACVVVPVTLNGSLSTASMNYAWTGPTAGTPAGTTPTAINTDVTTAGTYTLTVSDPSNGCSATSTVVVSPSAGSPTADAGTTQSLSCSVTTVTLDGSLSSPGLTYAWTGPTAGTPAGTTPSAITTDVTAGGTYTLTVTDSGSGCSSTSTVVVNPSPVAPTANAGNTQSITCAATTVTLDGSLSSAGLTYSWTGPTAGTPAGTTPTAITTDVTASGTYTITVTDGSTGCSSTSTVVVNMNNTAPQADAGTPQTITCAAISATLNGNLSTVGVNYAWTGPTAGTPAGTTPTAITTDVTSAGTYTITVTDPSNGCTASSTVSVAVNNTPPVANAGSIQTITCSVSTVTIDGSLSTSGMSYGWTGPTIGTPAGSTPTAVTTNVTAAGTYTLTVLDASNGCFASSIVQVAANNTPPVADAGNSQIISCSATTATIDGSLSAPGMAYSWTGPTAGTPAGTTPTALTTVINAAGTYTITVTNAANGCVNTDIVLVTTAPGVVAGFTSDVTSGTAPLAVNFTSTSTGATTYAWSFGDGNFASNATTPSNTYLSDGTYTVTLIAINGTCSDTATETIVVDQPFSLEIPNIFSPNGDQINDLFTIKTTGVKTLNADIFNRWGQKVYTISTIGQAWDGKMNNGDKASDGTYFFMIRLTAMDGKDYSHQGSVTLVK